MCKTELIYFLFFNEETDVHKTKYQLQIIACFQMLGLPKTVLGCVFSTILAKRLMPVHC